MASRFKTLTFEEVTELKEAAENKHTRKSTMNWVRVFEEIALRKAKAKGAGNYQNFDKTRVKLFPNFTRHHLITHTNCFALMP